MSVVLHDIDDRASLLPLRAAVAVCEACEALVAVRCGVKWPNDVWIDERKVAGILVEGRPAQGWAVLGIGLNVTTREFPTEIARTATSLALAGAPEASVEATTAAVLTELERWLSAAPSGVIAAMRQRDVLAGQPVRWEGGSGIAAALADDGALVVERDDGERVALQAGEVHLALERS